MEKIGQNKETSISGDYFKHGIDSVAVGEAFNISIPLVGGMIDAVLIKNTSTRAYAKELSVKSSDGVRVFDLRDLGGEYVSRIIDLTLCGKGGFFTVDRENALIETGPMETVEDLAVYLHEVGHAEQMNDVLVGGRMLNPENPNRFVIQKIIQYLALKIQVPPHKYDVNISNSFDTRLIEELPDTVQKIWHVVSSEKTDDEISKYLGARNYVYWIKALAKLQRAIKERDATQRQLKWMHDIEEATGVSFSDIRVRAEDASASDIKKMISQRSNASVQAKHVVALGIGFYYGCSKNIRALVKDIEDVEDVGYFKKLLGNFLKD